MIIQSNFLSRNNSGESSKVFLSIGLFINKINEPSTIQYHTGCIKKKFTVGKGLLMQKVFNAFNEIL